MTTWLRCHVQVNGQCKKKKKKSSPPRNNPPSARPELLVSLGDGCVYRYPS